jgi:hypothetical protein
MRKLILIVGSVFMFTACGNNNQDTGSHADTNKVHPVSETIPDSLKLVKDSTLVPDLQPGNGSAGTNDDSAKKQPH